MMYLMIILIGKASQSMSNIVTEWLPLKKKSDIWIKRAMLEAQAKDQIRVIISQDQKEVCEKM